MSFSWNPASYLGPRAKNPPEQLIGQSRAPTSSDYRNRILGDEWQDEQTTWYKLCSVADEAAVWDKFAGPFSKIATITAGDGTVVEPDANNNVDFDNGNGAGSDGSTNTVTFKMVSPFTGDFNFQSITGGDPEVLTVVHTVDQAGSDAAIHVQIEGTAGQDAYVRTGVDSLASYAMGLDSSVANEPWRLTYDGAGAATPSSATIGIEWDPIVGRITIGEEVLISVTDANDSTFTDLLVLRHNSSPAPQDGIGTALRLDHFQNDGSIVQGIRLYSEAPDAGTNVETTDLHFQNNVAGTLTDTAQLLSTGEFDAGSFGLPNLPSGSGYGRIIANAAIDVQADGIYAVASGTRLSGTFYLSWDFSAQSRIHEALVSVSTAQGDNGACLSILMNRALNSDDVFLDFYIGVDAGGIPALMVDIGNRNASVGNLIVSYYGDSARPDDGTQVDLAPVGFTAVSYRPYRGLQCDLNENAGGAILQDDGATLPADVMIVQHTMVSGTTAPDNMGSAIRLDHEQANGTIVQGARIYTEAPASATNVESSEFFLQVNKTGTLHDRVRVTSDGALYVTPDATVIDLLSFLIRGDTASSGGAVIMFSDSFFKWVVGFSCYAFGPNVITYETGGNNGGGGILQGPNNGFSIFSIPTTGAAPQTIPFTSLKTVDTDDQGRCYAYQFVTKTITGVFPPTWSVAPAGSYFYHEPNANASHGWYSADVATTDATPTTLASYTLSTNSVVTIRAIISCLQDTYAAAGGGTISFTVRRAGAGAVLVGAPVVDFNEDFGGAVITGIASGNAAVIQVTGLGGTNIDWQADYEIHQVV